MVKKNYKHLQERKRPDESFIMGQMNGSLYNPSCQKTKNTILHRPKRKNKAITRFCQWNDKTKPSPLTLPTNQYKSQHPVVVGKYSLTTSIPVHLARSSVVMLCCAPISGVITSIQRESPTSQPRTRSDCPNPGSWLFPLLCLHNNAGIILECGE